MDIQKERDAFEKHWIENFDAIDLEDTEYRDDLNMYEHPTLFADDLNKAWSSWQAAKVQAIPEGFVLVPIEPTEEMLGAAWEAPPVGGASGNRRSFYEKQTVVYKAMIEAAEGK